MRFPPRFGNIADSFFRDFPWFCRVGCSCGGHCSGGERASASQGCCRSQPSRRASRRPARPRRSPWPRLPAEAQAVAARDPARRPVRLPQGRHRLRQSRALACRRSRAASTANTPCRRRARATAARRRIVCGGTAADGARGLLLHRRPLRELSPDHAMSAGQPFFYDTGGTRHALADSPSEHRPVDPGLPGRRPDAGGAPRRPALPLRQPDGGAIQTGRARSDRRGVHCSRRTSARTSTRCSTA